jgi:hypothetical protein
VEGRVKGRGKGMLEFICLSGVKGREKGKLRGGGKGKREKERDA